MSPPVFLVDGADPGDGPDLDLTATIAGEGDRYTLTGPEGRHAATVLRLRPGERVDLTDGAGRWAECVVTGVGRNEIEVEVSRRGREAPRRPRLAVAQALPKGERGELAVEMMTEAGVDVIMPWTAARCVTRWRGERAAKGVRRWRGAARAAVKQSRGRWIPSVPDPVTTAQVAERISRAALGVILDESAATPLSALPFPDLSARPSGAAAAAEDDIPEIVLVVGPEGGLTGDEVTTLTAAGGLPVRLGPTVLRTSTAGLAAAAIVLSRCGRW